jgi:hypothetical protein
MADPPPTAPPFDAPRAARRVVGHFMSGVICPAEMWCQLADVLSKGDAHEILSTLPAALKAALRKSYQERPLSFWVLRGNPLRRQIKSWCRAPSSNE